MNLDELEAVAKAATPGCWFWHEDGNMYADPPIEPTEWQELGTAIVQTDMGHYGPEAPDRSFVAAFNPETAIKLIAVARAARAYMQANLTDEDVNASFQAATAALRSALNELDKP